MSALLVFIADVLLLTLLRLLIFSYFQEVVLARVQKLALDFVISEGKTLNHFASSYTMTHTKKRKTSEAGVPGHIPAVSVFLFDHGIEAVLISRQF